jgi:hypothetical protein
MTTADDAISDAGRGGLTQGYGSAGSSSSGDLARTSDEGQAIHDE